MASSPTFNTAQNTAAPKRSLFSNILGQKLVRKLAIALLALAPLVLASCFGGSGDSGSNSSSGNSNITAKVNTVYGEVTVPKPKEGNELRVVALGGGDADALLALGVKPVALESAWQGGDLGVYPWAEKYFGSSKPTVFPYVGTGEYNYEAIAAQKPDLITVVRGVLDKQHYDRLSQIAATVYAPPAVTASWTTSWQQQTQQIGDAVGKSADAKKLVADTEKKFADAKAANPGFSKLRAAFLSAGANNTFFAYLPGDTRWDFMADLGFQLDPGVTTLPATGFYATVPTDKLSIFNTQILAAQGITDKREDLLAIPLVAALEPIKDNRYWLLDQDTVYALAGASVLSLPVALEKAVPQLKEAASKVKS